MADGTALFCGDQLAVTPHVGVAFFALDVLFHQVFLMGEVESKNLGIDLYDSGMAGHTFGGDKFAVHHKTGRFIARSCDFEGLCNFGVGGLEELLGIGDIVHGLASFNDVHVESGLLEQTLSLLLLIPAAFAHLRLGRSVNTPDGGEFLVCGRLPLLHDPGKTSSVAGLAGFSFGDRGVAFDDPSSLFLMKNMTALTAQPLLEHDVGHRVVNSHSSFTRVEDFLGFVCICMTGQTVGNGVDILKNFVLDVKMALIAFDFVLFDVFVVHEVGVFVFVETLLLHVAFVAVFSGNRAVTHNGIAVTLVAVVPIVEDQAVIVPDCLTGEVVLMVAVRAVVESGGKIRSF